MKRKAAKKAPKKASTGLVVRPKVKAPSVTIHDPKGLMPSLQSAVGQLGELATVGALGLAELVLTEKEETALARPVAVSDVLIKPDGTPYLPWPAYSKWFSEAFGRLGWYSVPAGKPQKVEHLIVAPYLLYVHGKAVAFAWGEQEFHSDNKRQSYGDAIESTQGSALRRFAKRLQMGLELWDKVYLQRFKDEQCITVRVERRGEVKNEWRRKIDPPLPGEIRGKKQETPHVQWAEAPRRDEPPVIDVEPSSQLEPITVKQWERIAEISKRAGRDDAEVKLWLKKSYGVKNLKDIPRTHYAAICQQLEARGALPMPGDGQ